MVWEVTLAVISLSVFYEKGINGSKKGGLLAMSVLAEVIDDIHTCGHGM